MTAGRSQTTVHFDWAWRTLFNRAWEDVVFVVEADGDGEEIGARARWTSRW